MFRTGFVGLGTSLLFATALGTAPAQAASAASIERVALFKNGLGYFQGRLVLPDEKTVEIGQLPIPSHGTFWVGYDDKTAVKGVFAFPERVEREVAVGSTVELLYANVGRTVRLGSGEDAVTGVLERIVAQPGDAQPSPYVMREGWQPGTSFNSREPWSALGSNARSIDPLTGPLTGFLRTDEGTLAFDPRNVGRVLILGEPPATTLRRGEVRPTLRVELERPAPGRALVVSYLAKGITWAPSYRIDLSHPELAVVSAQATVVNEVADLQGAHVDLVTGFPRLVYGDVPSPVAQSRTLAEFLQFLARGGSGRGDGGLLGQQSQYVGANYAPSSPEPIAYDAPAAGREVEDLFLYPLEHVTLRRGETALYPLFSASMGYQHVYTWRVPDTFDDNGQAIQVQRPRDGEQREGEEVWHTVRVKNGGDLPLTTAPAMFVSDGQLVGQGTCPFTNRGGTADIAVNRALGLVAERGEVEVDRQRDAQRTRGYSYDRLRLRGELRVGSSMSRPVRLEVTRLLSGEIESASDAPRTTRTAAGAQRVNSTQELVWTIDLQPGESKTIEYVYTLLVRG